MSSPPIADSELGETIQVLLSTRTTQMVLVDQESARLFLQGQVDDLDPELVDELISAGLLVHHSSDELAEVLAENRLASRTPSVLYRSVLPSASCQLGCDYCGQSHHPRSMSDGVQGDLINQISRQLDADSFEELHIAWFGGEPLLALSTIRHLTHRLHRAAADHDCRYRASMVTNGLGLTADVARELALELSVDSVEVTLDGPAEHHDQRRVTKSGYGTFDQILANLLAVVGDDSHQMGITVRANVDAANAGSIPDLIDLLAQPPLRDRISFYVAPLHDWSNDAGKRALDKEEFARLEIGWLARMLRLGMRVPLTPRRKPVVCLSVNHHGSVTDPAGVELNCSEHALIEPAPGGTLVPVSAIGRRRGPRPPDGLSNFYDLVEAGDYQCDHCQMFPVCGGACPKSWLDGNVPCPSAKFNMPERLVLAYAGARLQA